MTQSKGEHLEFFPEFFLRTILQKRRSKFQLHFWHYERSFWKMLRRKILEKIPDVPLTKTLSVESLNVEFRDLVSAQITCHTDIF